MKHGIEKAVAAAAAMAAAITIIEQHNNEVVLPTKRECERVSEQANGAS